MVKEVLIIEDEKVQAVGLFKALSTVLSNVNFHYAYEENVMLDSIENKFFNLAIVDLRMDKFSTNGIELIEKIIEINPFAKIIIVTAFLGDFMSEIPRVIGSGKILSIVEKESFSTWIPKLNTIISDYYIELELNPNEISSALTQFYSDAKNEDDSFKKGIKFENFISLLFGSFGYKNISKRVIDRSRNEVDIVIRNEIDDVFMNKFGKYILIECKNKPKTGVGKNDFITFYSKLKNSNGLADTGLIVTSGYIGRNSYLEAMRTSNDGAKVFFLSNPEIEELISSVDKLGAFKLILDRQVKDN